MSDENDKKLENKEFRARIRELVPLKGVFVVEESTGDLKAGQILFGEGAMLNRIFRLEQQMNDVLSGLRARPDDVLKTIVTKVEQWREDDENACAIDTLLDVEQMAEAALNENRNSQKEIE